MHSIVIINVYFGKYPNYFPLWLKSAEANPTIDFLLITDQIVDDLPDNISVINMTMDDFSALASKKMGIDIHITRPYKLCDFKVTYGLVFEDYIKDYDFWGHCDLDLIWGDIRKYCTEKVLNNYDKIYPLGHFALYRNDTKMKNAFMLSGCPRGDYKKILTSEKNYAFDELFGIYRILEANKIKQYDQYDFADISPIYHRYKIVKKYTDLSDNYIDQIFIYDNGHIYRCYISDKKMNKEEFIYLHFQKRKFEDNSLKINSQKPYICSPDGFFNFEKKNINRRMIRKYNRSYGKVYEWAVIKFRNFKYKMGAK